MEEVRVREEVRLRRKEKCKMRNQELRTKELEGRENKSHKRRKLEKTGEYKTVYQVTNEERRVKTPCKNSAEE